MADKPKAPAKPAAPAAPSLEVMIMGAVGLFVLLFLIVLPAVLAAFNIEGGSFFELSTLKEFFITFVSKVFTIVTFISVFITLVVVILLLYIDSKKKQLLEKWEESQKVLTVGQSPVLQDVPVIISGVNLPGAVEVHGPSPEAGNEKWKDVEMKINSANPSDWRLAILEADILLDDMLKEMGLPGTSLGERLKSADESFFSTISEAWSAHKIRNIIAHEGAGYNLTYNEARRAIDLYRRVFEEFYFI